MREISRRSSGLLTASFDPFNFVGTSGVGFVDLIPARCKNLDQDSGVAPNQLTYENIRSYTHYHGGFGLRHCCLS